MRRTCRTESFYTTGTQKKIDCFNADGFCGHCNTVVERIVCFYFYCPYQEARAALTEEDIQHGTKKDGNRRSAKTVYRGENLHCCGIVGMLLVDTLKD